MGLVAESDEAVEEVEFLPVREVFRGLLIETRRLEDTSDVTSVFERPFVRPEMLPDLIVFGKKPPTLFLDLID